MEIKFKHKFRVESGKMKFQNLPVFMNEVNRYEGKEGFVTISDYKSTRSNKQNAFYWGIILNILSSETGNDPETIHEVLKDKFLGEPILIGKETMRTRRSTTSLSTKEFEEYMENIKRWAASELEIVLPDPEPNFG